jgi:uncharacterized membrane protein YtjA (UPF0391 family)
MFRWPALFLTIAVVAALFGFGGVAEVAGWLAQCLLLVYVATAAVAGLICLSRRP